MYPLAKFQPCMPLTVTALRSSNNRKIDIYSKYRENKLQAPTKMVVTYQQIEVWSYNFHHRVCHEQGNQLLDNVSLTHPSSLHTKAKFVKKNRSRMIASTQCKQTLTTSVSLGLLQRNKDFPSPIEQANKMISRVLLLVPSFTKK